MNLRGEIITSFVKYDLRLAKFRDLKPYRPIEPWQMKEMDGYTVKDLATIFAVNPHTIRYWVNTGKIPAADGMRRNNRGAPSLTWSKLPVRPEKTWNFRVPPKIYNRVYEYTDIHGNVSWSFTRYDLRKNRNLKNVVSYCV